MNNDKGNLGYLGHHANLIPPVTSYNSDEQIDWGIIDDCYREGVFSWRESDDTVYCRSPLPWENLSGSFV